MRRAAFAAAVLLVGCANPYRPDPLVVLNAGKYHEALDLCAGATAKWMPKVAAGDVAEAGLQGGAGYLAYLPVSPLVTGLGAAGAAGSEGLNGVDPFGHRRKNVEKHCVEDKTLMDGSAIMARPED